MFLPTCLPPGWIRGLNPLHPLLLVFRALVGGFFRLLQRIYFPETSTMTMKSIITLANSIIGVAILAMPYCFKQCGIILATLMVIGSGLIVKLSCHILLKSAILSRRRNYELLAFQTYGALGKLCVEISMIGFLMGTCIAFFVVIGDLAPPVVANVTGMPSSANLRLVILVALGIFVTLPLSMLRNVESLSGLCTLSIGFYCFVLSHIVIASWPSLIQGSWTQLVNYWRPAGIFQCLPIFCTALSCQPQIFEMYDALPDPSLATMNDIVKGAVNLCSGVYICVGIFGYIAFSAVEVGGNILTAFPPSVIVESIKIGFVLSVAVSFPLVIFPCRSSLHSLIFRKKPDVENIRVALLRDSKDESSDSDESRGSNPNDSLVANYIPPDRFNAITVLILAITLTLGIMIPDIEFVLGLVGSTIGCVICTIMPALMFIKLTSKNTTERIATQFCLFIGICIMVLGTYVNLQEANKAPDIETKLAHQEEILSNIVSQPPMPKPSNSGEPLKKPVLPGPSEIKRPELEGLEEARKPGDSGRKEPKEPSPPEEDDIRSEDKPAAKNETNKSVVAETDAEKQELKVLKTQAVVKAVEKELEDKDEKADKLIEELQKQKKEQKEILDEQKEVLKQMKEQMHANDEKKHENVVEQEPRAPPVDKPLVPDQVAAAPQADILPDDQEKNGPPRAQYQHQPNPNNRIPPNPPMLKVNKDVEPGYPDQANAPQQNLMPQQMPDSRFTQAVKNIPPNPPIQENESPNLPVQQNRALPPRKEAETNWVGSPPRRERPAPPVKVSGTLSRYPNREQNLRDALINHNEIGARDIIQNNVVNISGRGPANVEDPVKDQPDPPIKSDQTEGAHPAPLDGVGRDLKEIRT